MNLKWFASQTVRQAGDMSKHVRKMLDAQRDILSQQAIIAVEAALRELDSAVQNNGTEDTIRNRMTDLESAGNKWLKSYPNAGIRENVEVLLVALSVAMAIRTFIAQPFKIPTGSMQPTLFGVTSETLKGQSAIKLPGILGRLYEGVVFGRFYHYQVAEDDGEIVDISPPEHILKFINKSEITMRYRGGEKTYSFWMTPDDRFDARAGIYRGQTFRKGEEIVNFREVAGDHLLVDRLSYNFRRPTRGEIIVFETAGVGNSLYHLQPGQFYIKRMVAMGGENVQIGNDRHLIIDGKRLDNTTPHFEKVYSFDPKVPAFDSHYSGHLNQTVANAMGDPRLASIAPLFPDQDAVYQIPPEHYMVMGDNTANSFDSRAWGEFSRTNVIGKYFFVYWPFTSRFGCSVR